MSAYQLSRSRTWAMVLVAAGLCSCRTPDGPEAASTVATFHRGDVCCAYANSHGTHYQTRSCDATTESDALSCCRTALSALPIVGGRVSRVYPSSCDDVAERSDTDIELCAGPTAFREAAGAAGAASDFFAGLSRFSHVWVRMPGHEVGMGPVPKASGTGGATTERHTLQSVMAALSPSNMMGKLRVAWSDHTGFAEARGATCRPMYLCDRECLVAETTIGIPLGVYSGVNQCHSATATVLRRCGCYNYCTRRAPLTGACLTRVFPTLGREYGD